MRIKAVAFSLLLLSLMGLWWLSHDPDTGAEGKAVLVVHCAAGLRKPVEALAKLFEEQHGIQISLNFGGSGELYGKLKLAGGDVYIPADQSYTDQAVAESLVVESHQLALLTAVLMVPEGNPKKINSLADLAKGSIRVVLAEESAAVGKLSHVVLQQAGLLDAVISGNYSTSPTVNAVATQVSLNTADVGIVWDAIGNQYPKFQLVRVPAFESKKSTATAAVLKSSKKQDAAKKFVEFLSSSESGKAEFAKSGFEMIPMESP